jgi:hypothetical protein
MKFQIGLSIAVLRKNGVKIWSKVLEGGKLSNCGNKDASQICNN